jgi:hypothetical protein
MNKTKEEKNNRIIGLENGAWFVVITEDVFVCLHGFVLCASYQKVVEKQI